MAGRTALRLALLAIVLMSRLFVAAGTAGDDFTNNLFTDLAPLLGLFGEKFAQQFLAESFTIWDHILFAMAPLGVLTAIVGAIRVGGADWLKRLVGRARETFASAEIELMSSVSHEVCEVWNGNSIVRSMGSPQVKQIIHLPAREGDFSPESFITMDRKTWSRGYELKVRYWSAKDTGSGKLSTNEDNNGDIEIGHYKDTVRPLGDKELMKNKEIPPNISLNIHGGSNLVELVIYAFIATILQVSVLGWSSWAHKHKLTGSNPSVGFPLQAAGTVLLTLSLVLCAGIIDNGSREQHWLIEGESQVGTMSKLLSSAKFMFQALANKLRLAKNKSLQEKKHFRRRHMQLYWVQKQHIAGDNSFNPYILYAKELIDEVHESHRAKESGQNGRDDKAHETHRPKQNRQTDQDDKVHEPRRAKENGRNDRDDKFLRKLLRLFGRHLTTYAVVIGVLGFVAQFQGLRFSNWTCSIAQLIALGFATILRAWVRRSMTKTPVAIPVDNNDHILDHLTLAIVGRGQSDPEFPNPEALLSPRLSLWFGITTTPELRGPKSQTEPNLAQQALNLRTRLGRITKWTGPKSQEAIFLSSSIEAALERLNPKLPPDFAEKWPISLRVDTYRTMPHVPPPSPPNSQEEVELYIIKDGDKWKVDDGQLEALLSLVSYSVWANKQIKRNREETERGKSLARSESLGHLMEEASVKDSRSLGWLRAKAPDSRIYRHIVDKSSPRLLSDLRWWIPDAEQLLKEARAIHTSVATRTLADSTNYLSDAEAMYDKVGQPALGFYVDDEASGRYGKVATQGLLWRALTYPDTFYSWECKKRQVFILHLFSTFIWATAPYLSASQFHPIAVTSARELSQGAKPEFAQLKNDKIEMLVQEVQSTGLGTSEEIYKILIPPLSHFKKLPNEAVADFWNEMLIEDEVNLRYNNTFGGFSYLLRLVQYREAQDRFANRVAAMLVEFRLRVTESPSSLPWPDKDPLTTSNDHLRHYVNNNVILKAILSLNDILARRWDLPRDGYPGHMLEKLGFVDLLFQPQRENFLKEDLRTSDYTLLENDFSFPNNRDVFGWTQDYWEDYLSIVNGIYSKPDNYPFDGFKTLDLVGQSVLHHAVDRSRDSQLSDDKLESFHVAVLNGRSVPARCNKQTPLHRAARADHPRLIDHLLALGADPNAADHFGRTALCLAAHHGHSDVANILYSRMVPDGRNRTDRRGRNALHYAILNHMEEAALDLIKIGIDVNAEDDTVGSPLWYAALNDMKGVVESLLKKNEIDLTTIVAPKPRRRMPNCTITEELACRRKIAAMAETVRAPENTQVGWRQLERMEEGRRDLSEERRTTATT